MYSASNTLSEIECRTVTPTMGDARIERPGIESPHRELAPLGLRNVYMEPRHFKTDLLTVDHFTAGSKVTDLWPEQPKRSPPASARNFPVP